MPLFPSASWWAGEDGFCRGLPSGLWKNFANFVVMKKGLVLEGGALRGMYTCGILDVMMESGITVDGAVGVSAGACFGVNMKSRQPGRALRYSQRFARDKRYCSLRSLLLTGNLYHARFCYHTVPMEFDAFDFDTFFANPMRFYTVCTDVVTGTPVYHLMEREDPDKTLEWIRASASMPIVSTVVDLDGRKLLDGGMTDSIPLKFLESKGYDRNIVILTQPDGYVKRPFRLNALVRMRHHSYPRLARAMAERYKMYNAQTAYVKQQEQAGRVLVFRPEEKLEISRVSHDPDAMWRVYSHGRRQALSRIEEMREFLR